MPIALFFGRIYRVFLTVFLCVSVSNALELNISYGKQGDQGFSIITLKSAEDFPCETIYQNARSYAYVQCHISKIPENGFLPFNTEFFNISYEMQNHSFVLSIHPTKKIKLFYIPDSIQETQFFSEVKREKSKVWQIIGYDAEVPFLSPETKAQGINFPIRMKVGQYDLIGEINVDKNPLKVVTSPDYADYLATKDLMNNHDYRAALDRIAQTFKKYPNTFFAKDLLFFQIKALYHLGLYDNVVENGSAWVKAYASDGDVPEMLYILGNTYKEMHFGTEANHYYQRVIEQYPKSRFMPLAKMRLAKVFLSDNDIGMARIYFSQAYEEAKDLDSVTEIALQWAFFEIRTRNPENARELLRKILEKNPAYFTDHPKITKDTVAYLSDNKFYNSAALIAQYYFEHTNEDDSFHEPMGFILGGLYAKAGDFDAAHKSNQAYIKEYENFPKAKQIQKQDDELLFKVSGDDETKLERYDYIANKYPNTPESKEADKLKAELLIGLKRYPEALAIQGLQQDQPKLYDEALLGVINQNIEKNQCDTTNQYLINLHDFEHIQSPKKAFECLYNAKLYAQASALTKSQLKDPSDPEYLFWLYERAKVLNALDKYVDSTIASNDVLSIAKSKNITDYDDILFTLFDNLTHTDKRGARELYGRLESKFKDDPRMMKVYAWLLNDDKLDPTTSAIYAKNLLELQDSTKSSDYTPFVEFKLISAYEGLQQREQALEVADKLTTKQLSPQDMQKALYLKASLEIALKKDAKDTLDRCVKIDANSSWKELCKQSQGLIASPQDSGAQVAQQPK